MFNNSKTKKVLILIMVIAITYSNFLLVGATFYKGLTSYAADETVIPEGVILEDEEKEEIEEPVFEINVDTLDIHKTQMKEETEFYEKIGLKLANVKNIKLEDAENNFYNKDEEVVEEANLRYVKTVLNKEEFENVFGKEGKFIVLDDQDNEIVNLSSNYICELELDEKVPQNFVKTIEVENEDGTVTKEEQEEERSYVTVTEDSILIEYNVDMKEVKIHIDTEINKEKINFVIENTKVIYDVQDLDNLNYLKQNVKYDYEEIKASDEEAIENEEDPEETEELITENIINFKSTYTRATFNMDNLIWTLGEANVVNCEIELDTTSENSELYKNPTFIVELPDCVDSINTENSIFTVEDDGNVFEEKNVSIVDLLGRKYIAIRLTGEQTEESIQNGNTIIFLSLELNLKAEGEPENIRVYYKNDTVTAYSSDAAFDTISCGIEVEKKIEETVVEENSAEQSEQQAETEIATVENNIIDEKAGMFYVETSLNKEYIRPKDMLEQTVTLHNTKTEDVNNVKVIYKIPEGIDYSCITLYDYSKETFSYDYQLDTSNISTYNEETRTLEINIDNFPAATVMTFDGESRIVGSAKKLTIFVKPTELEEDVTSKAIDNRISVIANETEIPVEELKTTVIKPTLEIQSNEIKNELNPEDMVEFDITIKNYGLVAADNTDIRFNLPEEFEPCYVETNDSSYSVSVNNFSANVFVPAQGTYTIKLFATYVNTVEADKDINIVANINEDKSVTWATKLINPDAVAVENPEEIETELTNITDDVVEKENEKAVETSFEESSIVVEQFLNRVTVSDSENSKEYTYDNVNSAKIKLDAEAINDGTITMEYKVIVKNIGSAAEYGKQLVDYVAEGVEFNVADNTNWYQAEDNNIYNDVLVDKLIEPGESIELAIKLSKKLSNSNIGTIKNFVKLKDGSNNSDIKLESVSKTGIIPGHGDTSLVEINVSTKANVVFYTSLTIACIAIVAFGIYMIKRTVLNNKEVN